MYNLRMTRLRQGYAEAGDLRIFITLARGEINAGGVG